LLGSHYERGDNVHGFAVTKDHERAVFYFELGCRRSDAMACRSLGDCFRRGAGVEKDDAHAASLYVLGCDGGDAFACASLGHALYTGAGVDRDRDAALSYFKRGCTSSNPPSCEMVTALEGTGRRAVGDAPVGAMGFSFGMSASDAKRACTSSERDWKPLEPDSFMCVDANKNWGIKFPLDYVSVRICSGAVCEVTLAVPSNQYWDVVDELSKLYGTPGNIKYKMPTECNSASAYMQCINTGRADVSALWLWPNDAQVMSMVTAPYSEWSVYLVYSSPQAVALTRADGL
jgi:TPR repeat protein